VLQRIAYSLLLTLVAMQSISLCPCQLARLVPESNRLNRVSVAPQFEDVCPDFCSDVLSTPCRPVVCEAHAAIPTSLLKAIEWSIDLLPVPSLYHLLPTSLGATTRFHNAVVPLDSSPLDAFVLPLLI
jgi:hypothetical protein